MHNSIRVLAPLLLLAPGGCIVGTVAKTAASVATMPVKAVSFAADKMTTSQAEADQKAGRALRQADEQRAREEREAKRRAPPAASAY